MIDGFFTSVVGYAHLSRSLQTLCFSDPSANKWSHGLIGCNILCNRQTDFDESCHDGSSRLYLHSKSVRFCAADTSAPLFGLEIYDFSFITIGKILRKLGRSK